ncbi:uncharacterized protein LOC126997279 [Eriocheir sinensis]|uniref:uncharacterized protein LOC126997279 n=1 Tax=Eriocheir sinensis TaxID=95602 RepID=UPI0021CA1257|nr:uncharacterized protein LOC126997279 [Eriocheir sinensis]
MLMVRKGIRVEKVIEGEGLAEVLKVETVGAEGRRRQYVVGYVPPRTNAWKAREYEVMIQDTVSCLDGMLRESERIILMGDFNCKEVEWEDWRTQGTEESWGGRLLQLAMEHVLTQWIKEHTRFGKEGEASRLDLVFSKEPEVIENIKRDCPIAKSDHAIVEFEVKEKRRIDQKEDHKIGRRNYCKADFVSMRTFFENANWSGLYKARSTQDKWEEFLKLYKEAENRYVPKVTKRDVGKKERFNKRCEAARKRKEEAWKGWRRRGRINAWNNFKQARNEHTKIRREEKRKYEKDIIDKCKDQPKLFYRHVNDKLKNRETINKLKMDGTAYEDPAEMAEVMNNSFHRVFTKEDEFVQPPGQERGRVMQEIQLTVQEVKESLNKLDVRKATGPDEVSGWILKECSEQLAEKFHSIMSASLSEGRVPQDWKRANMVPIYKGGKREDPLNYRPVSLTSVVAKICERLVKNR